MTNARKPKLVLAEWLDSAQPIPGWRFLADAPKPEVVRCYSVGWLIAMNKRATVLAPNIGNMENGGSPQGSGFIRIPTLSITRLVELVEND
mgnify:CR=1 FL=1